MASKIETENAQSASTCWLASPETKVKLASTLKVTSDAGAGFLLDGARMADMAAHFTTQVPRKTGAPDKLRLILGDWSQVMLGIWSEIDILTNPFDSTAYARGGVKVRAMSTVDIGVRQPKAFVVAEDLAV